MRPSVAIAILAHKNPRYVRELISRLSGDEVALFLHLDIAAGDPRPFIPAENKSLVLVEPRRRCPWGEDAVIDAILDLLRASRKHAPVARYVSLISGQDWPLVDMRDLVEQLCGDAHAGYMSAKALPADDLEDGGLPRMTRYWVPERVRPAIFRRSIQLLLNKLMPPRSVQELPPLHYGGLWFDLRSDLVDYIVSFTDRHPGYRPAFRWTRCTDELFFHSIIFNSPFKDEIRVVIDPDHCRFGLRFIDWGGGHYGVGPRILGPSDLPEARASGALFARKFDDVPE